MMKILVSAICYDKKAKTEECREGTNAGSLLKKSLPI